MRYMHAQLLSCVWLFAAAGAGPRAGPRLGRGCPEPCPASCTQSFDFVLFSKGKIWK